METETHGRTIREVEFTSAGALRSWLIENHTQPEGVWAITYKKHVVDRYVSRDEVLDELLCFGWIDGARRKLDDDRTMQLISPRRQQVWARTYQRRIESLVATGRVHESGVRSIEVAKATGLWNALDDVDDLIVDDDLASALGTHRSVFDNYPISYRRNVLRWIAKAKTEATRTKRIVATVESTASGSRLKNL
jgi:uncharacterized protein YdeI (YjbR/CyaY-like superfamily)